MIDLSLQLNLDQLPQHVAIIMDGNGRWAKKRFLPRFQGHRSAMKTVRMVIETAVELKLNTLTLYAFSTENWSRPPKEVSVLMDLFAEYLKKELVTFLENNIRLQHIGDRLSLPGFVQNPLDYALEATKNNTGMVLNLAVNYGARAEILRAVRSLAEQLQSGTIVPEEVNENLMSQHLYTAQLRDPDLIIRTSGEQRISNFLLWQSAYSELYFTEILWPDFTQNDFYHALHAFQQRQRRMGGI